MTRTFRVTCTLLFFALAFSSTAYCQQGGERLGVGRHFPSEWIKYVDAVTGAEITMLTTSPAKDDKIYQTHPSWTADQ